MSIHTNEEFTTFVPLHYEKNYSYPLIVWLHSDGKDGNELNEILPHVSVRNFVGIAPKAPVGNFEAGYFWEQEADTIDFTHDLISSALDSAKNRFNINRHRVFLAGAGAGGTMAYRIGLERPELFAGVISLNGPLPKEERPLMHWNTCRDLPVFWAHSRQSGDFPQSLLCEQLRLLHIAGFSVTLRQYPGEKCLHKKTLGDLNRWIMEMFSSTIS